MSGNYPEGVTDADPYFDMPGVGDDEDDDERTTNEDGEPRYRRVSCSRCGLPTTFDPTYGDLCYRCCRADNE